jgi:hypothetical protein
VGPLENIVLRGSRKRRNIILGQFITRDGRSIAEYELIDREFLAATSKPISDRQ